MAVVLALFAVPAWSACDRYDGTNLTMERVIVGNLVYANVVAQVSVQDVRLVGTSFASAYSTNTYDLYDTATGLLTSPCIIFNGSTYSAVVLRIGINQVRSYSSFSTFNTPTPTPILNFPLPDATVGTAYQQQLVIDTFPRGQQYTFSMDTLANGNGLPTGMTLNQSGILSGTPFATGAADVNGKQIPHSYTFGVCATDTFTRSTTTSCPQTTITVNPALPDLNGKWTGSWNWTSVGDGGCTYHDSGNVTLNLKQTNGAVTGTFTTSGIELRYTNDCSFAMTTNSQGNVTGTVTNTDISLQYTAPISETGGSNTYKWAVTVSGTTTLKGTAVSTKGSTGSFTLTKQ
jgi:hypothetical protein